MRNTIGFWVAIFLTIWIAVFCGRMLEKNVPDSGQPEDFAQGIRESETSASEEGAGAETSDPAQAFLGEWLCGDSLIAIYKQEDGTYRCVVDRMENENVTILWEYACDFDGYSLTGASTGVKTSITRDESEGDTLREVLYDDGYGIFQIDENGELIWSDFKELAGFGMMFVKQ